MVNLYENYTKNHSSELNGKPCRGDALIRSIALVFLRFHLQIRVNTVFVIHNVVSQYKVLGYEFLSYINKVQQHDRFTLVYENSSPNLSLGEVSEKVLRTAKLANFRSLHEKKRKVAQNRSDKQ